MIADAVVVFSAEFTRRLRSRPFLLGLAIGALVLLVTFRLPGMLASMSNGSTKRIVVMADGALRASAAQLLGGNFTIAAQVPDAPATAAILKAHDASSIVRIVPRGDSLAITIFAKNPGSVPSGEIRRDLLPLELQRATNLPRRRIVAALAIPADVRALASRFGSSQDEDAAQAAVFAMLFLLYLTVVLNSQLIMSSVAEEKTSRIAELLIAAIDPAALLAGKIAAGAALALLQLALWVACGVLLGNGGGSGGAGAPGLTGLISPHVLTSLTVGAFIGFFLLGLLQLSTLFAGIASMINRTEDIGSMSLPLVFPVIVAFLIALGAIGAPDAPLVVTTSFLPLFAPFVMFARIVVGSVPAWQIALSFAINIAALVAIAWAAGRIYRVGMLFYGRAPSFKQIWNALRGT